MGFPGVGSGSLKAPGRKQSWWLLARPVETSDLSGPQELLLPWEGKVTGRRGRHREEHLGKKELSGKHGLKGEWEDPTEL